MSEISPATKRSCVVAGGLIAAMLEMGSAEAAGHAEAITLECGVDLFTLLILM